MVEIIIWGDQNDPRVFDCFMENDMLTYLKRASRAASIARAPAACARAHRPCPPWFWLDLICQPSPKAVHIQALQLFGILMENLKTPTSLCKWRGQGQCEGEIKSRGGGGLTMEKRVQRETPHVVGLSQGTCSATTA